MFPIFLLGEKKKESWKIIRGLFGDFGAFIAFLEDFAVI